MDWHSGKYIPVKVAARLLRVSRQRVHQLIGTGQLGHVVIEGMKLVRRESVAARQDEMARRGKTCR